MKPTFLIIGTMKSGTTSAEYYMNQHPDIYCHWGEIRFFDRDSNYEKGIDWYEKHFTKTKKVVKHRGEKTPIYSFFRKCILRIKHHYPDIKLIIFLRDPVMRAYSQYNHMIQESKKKNSKNKYPMYIDPKTTFKSLIHSELKNLNYREKKSIVQRGFYIDQIEFILKYFPRKNLKIIITEWYLKDHIKWNNELFEFLEVETLEYLKPEMQHKRNYIIDKYKEDFNLLKKIYRPYNKRLFKFLGFKIKEWV